jgi:hypothetical protein
MSFFLKLNSLSLHTRLISDYRSPTMVCHRNLQVPLESGNIWPPKYCWCRNSATSGHRRQMPADQIQVETDRNPAMFRSRLDLAKMAGIRSDLTGSGNGNRMLPDSGDNCIFVFRNFFVRTKSWKIFSRKSFFF